MPKFIIIAKVTVNPGKMAAFLPVIRQNAETSVREEPGCRQFDVVVPEDGGDVLYLYEIYDDEAAFDAHIASEHFKNFRLASEGLAASFEPIRGALAW